jgi:hypothetical protein
VEDELSSELQKQHFDLQDRLPMPRIWSFLWRGAVGGILGALLLVGVAIYRNPMNVLGLGWLPTFVLLASIIGLFVGAMVSFFGQRVRRRLGIIWRVILGTMLTSVLQAIYLYLAVRFDQESRCGNCLSTTFREGFGENPRGFIVNLFFIALLIGGLAGALATGKSRKDFPKEDHSDQLAGNNETPLWSVLWRGAIGGVVGAVALIIYRFLTNPYRLNDLLIAVLISVGNGVFVGAFIWFLGRWLRRTLGVALRIIAATLFSICSIAFYLYLQGGLNGDIGPFIINTLAVGLMLGVPAGAIAKENRRFTN